MVVRKRRSIQAKSRVCVSYDSPLPRHRRVGAEKRICAGKLEHLHVVVKSDKPHLTTVNELPFRRNEDKKNPYAAGNSKQNCTALLKPTTISVTNTNFSYNRKIRYLWGLCRRYCDVTNGLTGMANYRHTIGDLVFKAVKIQVQFFWVVLVFEFPVIFKYTAEISKQCRCFHKIILCYRSNTSCYNTHRGTTFRK
jgi:hypothetical protein